MSAAPQKRSRRAVGGIFDEVVLSSPVHSLTILDPGGTGETTHSVYCRMRSETVSLPTCNHCDRARSLPLHADAPDADITCAPLTRALKVFDLRDRANVTAISLRMNRTTIAVRPDSALETVERCLLEADQDAAVVVDDDGRPIGIVTKTDLLRALFEGAADHEETAHPDLPSGVQEDSRLGTTAADLMTAVVHALPEDAPLSFGVGLLAAARVEQVPIVGMEGKLAGLFSQADVIAWLARELGYFIPEASKPAAI